MIATNMRDLILLALVIGCTHEAPRQTPPSIDNEAVAAEQMQAAQQAIRDGDTETADVLIDNLRSEFPTTEGGEWARGLRR